ncbi:MAG TPA: phage portal protein [Gammaproteobacteria bacterium]|nr:phage portal protein [Gammaproteobacteria bacterium]
MSKASHVDPESGKMVIGEAVATPKAQHFEGAKVDRFTGDWITRNATMDSLLETSLCKLRARSRYMVDNDGYAANWMNQNVANVIGDNGFALKIEAKQKSGADDKTASKKLQQAWKNFCKAENFTVGRDQSEHAFDCLFLRSIACGGGGLARIVRQFDNKFRFAVQGLPIDLLDPDYYDNNRRISMSVEKSGFEEVSAYHLLQNHPGDRWGGSNHGPRTRVDAKNIIHAFIREEFGQSQGKPWLTPVIARLRQLHEYEAAELIKARAEASTHIFFETSPEAGPGYQGEGKDPAGNIVMDGSPGTSHNLPTGVKANLLQPTSPNANYPTFRKGMLRGIAAGLVTNYNILGQDLEGVNYSSIRQGVLAERDMWKLIQRWYIDTVKRPIFEQWLEWYLLTGDSGYGISDFERLNHPEFSGRRWDWVDPDKDSKADERRLKNRLTSHQRVARSRGEDHETILQECREDEKNAEGSGKDQQLDLFLDMPEQQTVEAEVAVP